MSEPRGGRTAPESPFPLLPLRTGVLFPGTVLTLPVGRKRSVALIQSLHAGDVIGVVTQRDPKVTDPRRADLYDTGTFVRVVEISQLSGDEYRLALEGLSRLALQDVSESGPFWMGEGSVVDEEEGNSDNAKKFVDWALTARAQALATNAKVFNLPSNADALISPLAPKIADIKLIDYDTAKYATAAEHRRLIDRWEKDRVPLAEEDDDGGKGKKYKVPAWRGK